MPLNAKLVVVGGDVKTAEIKLRLPSTIGRGRGATILLPHPLVSRQHCELFEAQGRLMVRDLGSLNGTFINNERINEAPLPTGDLLTVGAVTFRAIYEADSGASMGEFTGGAPGSESAAVDRNGTVRAPDTPGKPPRTSAPTVNMEEPIAADLDSPEEASLDDFDLSQPIAPVDEGARITIRADAPAFPDEEAPAEARKTDPSVTPAAGSAAAGNNGPAGRAAPLTKPESPSKPSPTSGQPAANPSPSRAVAPSGKVPEKKDEPTVHFAAWENEEGEIRPAVIEDEDFGDFLKSLEKKP
jgi:predicted component of type VI protein secretion system